MECKDILNLIAIVVIPIVAVIIGQHLQNRAEVRKDKMHIFKVLMSSRIYGWTQEKVHCLNIIDIVFSDDRDVRSAWKELYDKYCVQNPNEMQMKLIQNAQYKLLETMAKSLGYKNNITWETIQNPYIPKGMLEQMDEQNRNKQRYDNILENLHAMMDKNNDNKKSEKL